MIKKKSTAFLISDFYDTGYEDALKIASKKHDVVAIRITDEKEKHNSRSDRGCIGFDVIHGRL